MTTDKEQKPGVDAAYLQGMKDGATAAVLAIVSTLEKSWTSVILDPLALISVKAA
jgi:hypothetical protein